MPKNYNMKVFVIIVIYNGLQNNWIQQCFDSLLNSTISYHIVAIDNASTDDSVNYIKQNYPSAHLIENKENNGFGGANNQGLKYALENGGEYFFLLNQDAWVEANTIEQLIYQLKINPEYGIVSPIHLNGQGKALDLNFSNYIAPNRCENLYSDFVLNQVKDTIYESGFICAAAWLLSKESLRIVGGFNPSFFHYGEDDNYVHRLTFKKLKIGVYPKVFIYHDRENREKSKYFNPKALKERSLFITYSNPNLRVNYQKEIKIINNKILKNILLLNLGELKRLSKQKKLLKLVHTTSYQNLELSKSNSKYIFLND